MNLKQIKHAAFRLSLGQLSKLDEWVHELISKAEETKRVKITPTRKHSVATENLDNKTYRLQSIRCGKEKCKCSQGKLHGPYWYSYVRVEGRVKSQYVGKKLPRKVEREMNKSR